MAWVALKAQREWNRQRNSSHAIMSLPLLECSALVFTGYKLREAGLLQRSDGEVSGLLPLNGESVALISVP